jgi:tetratricopeptide (TPR) repeat protein
MSLVERALALKPGDAEILTNTGTLLARTGKHKEALAHYQRAIGIDPAYASAHLGASSLLALEAKWPQVVEHLHAARQLDPDDPQAMERLAWLLATCPVDDLRDGAQALALAERANHITGKQQVRFLNTLAAALAESGHFGRARETIARAIAILEKAGRKQAADRLAAIVRLYASNKPYRQGR